MFNIIFLLPMTGFEPRTSGFGSDRSANFATVLKLGGWHVSGPIIIISQQIIFNLLLSATFSYVGLLLPFNKSTMLMSRFKPRTFTKYPKPAALPTVPNVFYTVAGRHCAVYFFCSLSIKNDRFLTFIAWQFLRVNIKSSTPEEKEREIDWQNKSLY